MHPLIQLKRATPVFLVALALACFGLSPTAQAVVPAPDGGYPGGNTAEGQAALLHLTTGGFNTAVGFLSLRRNTTGSFNTAVGAGTLLANTAIENTATGAGALLSDATGANNTANGAFALFSNTTGIFNTAIGDRALLTNTTANSNTAAGAGALQSNTTGALNTALGASALLSNTTGAFNAANGVDALAFNTTGASNTADGTQALQNNTAGTFNTAVGGAALINNTIGGNNTATGSNALGTSTTGNDNTALGASAGTGVTTASNVICIGAGVSGVNVDNTCFIGNIRGVTTQNANAIPVLIDSAGQLGTASSSRRYKTDIKPIDKASESVLALKPVSFRYKVHKDITPQFGLIAEEVAEVNSDLVIYDADGKPETVRYEAVNAMLLNEFLKEHRKVQEQQATIAQLKAGSVKQEAINADQRKAMEALTATVKEQTSQIQKVSAQLATSKPAPQVAENNQ
jgi:hypothetical protein